MPRKQFLADLKEAQLESLPHGIHSLRTGDDDGQFEFTFRSSASPQADLSLHVTAIVSDVSDYPASHEYMIFCEDDGSPQLASQLQSIRGTNRKTVSQLVKLIASELAKAVDLQSDLQIHDVDMNDVDELDTDNADDSDGYDAYDVDDDDDDADDEVFLTGAPPAKPIAILDLPAVDRPSLRNLSTTFEFRDRLRRDLRATKDAGFRVGVIGDISDGSAAFVTVSIRIAKLGISDEAMLAWQLKAEEYLVLLIYYQGGYKTNEQLQSPDGAYFKSACAMRVYSGKSYKPTRKQAIAAFQKSLSTTSSSDNDRSKQPPSELEASSELRPTFLSSPLARLLNDELTTIIRFRALGMDWAGAEAWYRDREGSRSTSDNVPERYFHAEHSKGAFPAIVTDDHYANRDLKQYSFPLVAMQFTLRHFVRCVEFCLVCHRKIDSELEAIKPYVCERPLCLFQYMAMGFGPSIEHEVLTQPYVSDLLISFCYSAASSRTLMEKDLPTGLGMKVPCIRTIEDPNSHPMHRTLSTATKPTVRSDLEGEEFDIGFDRANLEIRFLDRTGGGCPVVRGSWVVVRMASDQANTEVLHCRVIQTNFFPVITIDTPIPVSAVPGRLVHDDVSNALHTPPEETPPHSTHRLWTPCTLQRYDQDFDTLSQDRKCDSIAQLLSILPSIRDMQDFLHRSTVQDLKRWTDRIPQAALQLLRWIIASNRACIMQVDDCVPGEEPPDDEKMQPKRDRLYGMQNYMQFRFAMGAPDKEERFMAEVKKTRRRLKLQYPTIFAWHGSPLYNWHMIIREGLHFNKQEHGRAFGHGVYHAKDARTSVGYSGRGANATWPNSALKISTAMALNELVNAPAEFVSESPYYVVSQLDWIQTRYLLVQCNLGGPESTRNASNKSTERKPDHPHPQDPFRTPTGLSDSIIIPASAIKSGSRGQKSKDRDCNGGIKRLKGNSGERIVAGLDSDMDSTASDEEDRDILRDETSETTLGAARDEPVGVLRAKPMLSQEDYVAGLLEFSTLPMMPLPTYASQATTKRLMNELRSLQKLLDTTPLRDLGWYIDTSRIDNVYQWIVELHSFHTFEVKGQRLPMADDMKQKGIKSVVLEIRFGADFPFSPPYIRVVRPRFLSFMQGGGGHIVMGGAMCMELLTNTGWSGISSMESVLMQVRLAMASEPFARLDMRAYGDYGAAEAADGYIRACKTHGWTVPPGFQEVAHGMSAAAEEMK